jgi:hypothetical protein
MIAHQMSSEPMELDVVVEPTGKGGETSRWAGFLGKIAFWRNNFTSAKRRRRARTGNPAAVTARRGGLRVEGLESRTTVSDVLLGFLWPAFAPTPRRLGTPAETGSTSRNLPSVGLESSTIIGDPVAAFGDQTAVAALLPMPTSGRAAEPPTELGIPTWDGLNDFGVFADQSPVPLRVSGFGSPLSAAAPVTRSGNGAGSSAGPEIDIARASDAINQPAVVAPTPGGQAAENAAFYAGLRLLPSGGGNRQQRDNPFQVSWQAGSYDGAGRYMGGTELMFLVAHKGMLFAGTSVWEDVPGDDPTVGAQILRLDSANGQWQVDKQFNYAVGGTPVRQRITAMDSFTFTTDGQGNQLPEPVTILLAAPTDLFGRVSVYSRNDLTGTWTEMRLANNVSGGSVRAMGFHHDTVNGVDRVFAGADHAGTFSGVYDPTAPGGIRWDSQPEQVYDTRAMSFTEVNHSLLMANSPQLSKRIDGPQPHWETVVTYQPPIQGANGLRGLTAIPGDLGIGQALLAGFEDFNSYILRFSPFLGYIYTVELDIKAFLMQQWGGLGFPYAVPAYNDMLAVTDPQTGEATHIVTLSAFSPNPDQATSAWYLVRHDADRSYDLHEIQAIATDLQPNPTLIGTRTMVISPFPEDGGQVVYVGGYDAYGLPTHNSAWLYKAPLGAMLGDASS